MNQSKNSEKKEKKPKISVPNPLDVRCPGLAAKKRTPELELEEAERRGPEFPLTNSNRNKRVTKNEGMTQAD